MADRYEIVSVADFVAIPGDKREHCLKDFAMWCSMHAAARAIFGDVAGIAMQTNKFIWIDDGRHDAHLHVVVKAEASDAR